MKTIINVEKTIPLTKKELLLISQLMNADWKPNYSLMSKKHLIPISTVYDRVNRFLSREDIEVVVSLVGKIEVDDK